MKRFFALAMPVPPIAVGEMRMYVKCYICVYSAAVNKIHFSAEDGSE